jgi:hypothetical protein
VAEEGGKIVKSNADKYRVGVEVVADPLAIANDDSENGYVRYLHERLAKGVGMELLKRDGVVEKYRGDELGTHYRMEGYYFTVPEFDEFCESVFDFIWHPPECTKITFNGRVIAEKRDDA